VIIQLNELEGDSSNINVHATYDHFSILIFPSLVNVALKILRMKIHVSD